MPKKFQKFTALRKALEFRRTVLDEIIEEENGRPMPDTLRLTTLKRRRLHLKQRIEALR